MNQSNQIIIPHSFNYTKNNNTMETNQFFSTTRFRHLMSRELAQKKKMILLAVSAIFLIVFINAMGWAYNREIGFAEFGYPFYLVIAGCIFTSFSFAEMDQSYGKQFYLLLPSSHFEKFLSKWLITAIGYFLSFTLGFILIYLIANLLSKAIFDFDLGPLNLFSAQNRFFMQFFFAVQTIYFLGAVYFRKYVVFKTILSQFLVIVISILTGLLLFRLVMFDLFDGLYHFNPQQEINGKMMPVQPGGSTQLFLQNNIESYVKLWGLWIIPAILLVVSYFKLKETEL